MSEQRLSVQVRVPGLWTTWTVLRQATGRRHKGYVQVNGQELERECVRACERDHGLEKVGLGKEVIKVRCDQHGQCYVRLLDDVSKAMCRYMDRSGRERVCVCACERDHGLGDSGIGEGGDQSTMSPTWTMLRQASGRHLIGHVQGSWMSPPLLLLIGGGE